MGIVSRFTPELRFAGLIVEAILFSLIAIVVIIVFIAARRWYRGRYFDKLNERTLAMRSQWNDILSGTIPAKAWRLNRLDCEIVESILLDSLEVAALPEEIPPLL